MKRFHKAAATALCAALLLVALMFLAYLCVLLGCAMAREIGAATWA